MTFATMMDHSAPERRLEAAVVEPASLASEPAVFVGEEHVLETLIHHAFWVAHDLPLEEVHHQLRAQRLKYAALVCAGKVTGLCSRDHLGLLLGSRFGFALNAQTPAHTAQVPHPLIFSRGTPVREILERTFARGGDEFQEDVVLIDESQRLLGLIPVQALAQLQARLMAGQLIELRQQQQKLGAQNLELFRANHAQRQAQGLSQALFQSVALGVALLDHRGEVHAHNRRLEVLLGLTSGLDDRFSFLPLIVEAERALFADLLRAYEGSDFGPVTREFHVLRPDGAVRLCRFSTGWITETGQICACLDDITEQRLLERHVQRQEKQVLLDTLVGGIAHELNNKLTPVLGFTGLLTPLASGPERLYLSHITQSVAEAAAIIRQLLQLSKPQSGEQEFMDLRKAVEEAIVMLKFEIRESGAIIRVEKPPEPIMILGVHGQLKQVIINLAINALQAMEHQAAKYLTIACGCEGDNAWLSVRDTGTGITPEILGRIFDPFFTTKGPDRGTGLGLSICFSIMRQHGGDLTVESEPGHGSTFKATFPLALTPTLPEASPPPRPNRTRLPVEASLRHRVLVVDDEDVVRRLVQETLRRHFGCTVESAVDGLQALRRIETEAYHLIISDVRMPALSGPDLYRRLRDSHPDLAKRFVFMTGHLGGADEFRQVSHWPVPVVTKPFPVERLVEVCSPFLADGPMAAPSG